MTRSRSGEGEASPPDDGGDAVESAYQAIRRAIIDARIAAHKTGALDLRQLEECCLRAEDLEDARQPGYLDALDELNSAGAPAREARTPPLPPSWPLEETAKVATANSVPTVGLKPGKTTVRTPKRRPCRKGKARKSR